MRRATMSKTRQQNNSSNFDISQQFKGKIFELAAYLIEEEPTFSKQKKSLLRKQLERHKAGVPDRENVILSLFQQWLKQDSSFLAILGNFKKKLSVNTTSDGEQIIKILQEKHNIHATKRINILGRDKMEYVIQANNASTKQRLADRVDLDWAIEVICYLVSMNIQNNDHFLLRPDNNAFYYGADEGQRLCVQAAKYINSDLLKEIKEIKEINNINKDNKEITRIANNLLAAVKKEMDSEEKQSWKCVSNYWLAGNMQKGLGLTGERYQGRLNITKWMEASQQALKEITQGEVQIINFSAETKAHDQARKLFIHNFRASQVNAKKNWTIDVNREDYQHKPRKNSTCNQKDEDLINRRMCKWTLHTALYNNQPLVYALDKLELSPIGRGEILHIKDSNNDQIKLKVPVCTSELREVFRNIDKFETNISYYKGLKKTSAPWEEGNAPSLLQDWAEYAMHLTRSLLIQYPGDVLCFNGASKMLTAWSKNEWELVIEVYKTIKPSELYQPVLPSIQKHIKNHETRMKQAKKLLDKETAQAVAQVVEDLTGCIERSCTLRNCI
jgi:hypothetical protein